MAPPFEFLERCFVPVLARMGAQIELRLEKHGFLPDGDGRLVAEITGGGQLRPVELLRRGALVQRQATALVAGLPGTIAIRELRALRDELDWKNEECLPKVIAASTCPSNALLLELAFEDITELITSFGHRDLAAEEVAARGAREVLAYLATDAPVGHHLADQLIIPFSLAGGGRFRTARLSDHARTNIDVVEMFVPKAIEIVEGDVVEVRFK